MGSMSLDKITVNYDAVLIVFEAASRRSDRFREWCDARGIDSLEACRVSISSSVSATNRKTRNRWQRPGGSAGRLCYNKPTFFSTLSTVLTPFASSVCIGKRIGTKTRPRRCAAWMKAEWAS